MRPSSDAVGDELDLLGDGFVETGLARDGRDAFGEGPAGLGEPEVLEAKPAL